MMERHDYNQRDYSTLLRLGADFDNPELGRQYRRRRQLWNLCSVGQLPESTLLDLGLKYQPKPAKAVAANNGKQK